MANHLEAFEKIKNHLPVDIAEDLKMFESILREHGATKIILYGSMARGDFHNDSDIDLCFEGIPDYDYFRVLSECLMRAKRRINLIDFESTRGHLRENILTEGKIIYANR